MAQSWLEIVKRTEPNSADMKPIGIAGIGSYVAPKVMTNQDWTKYVDTSDEWIYSKTGIRERRIADPNVATSDLAAEASRRAMADAGINAEDVDLIVLATSSPDVPLSATACIVQYKLGARNAAALDINNVCSDFIYGLDIGWKMAAADTYQNVLVIGAETYSRILNWKDRTTCVFFGDGAGAVVLKECKKGQGLLASTLYSDGSGHKVIEIPAGGSRIPTTHETLEKGLNYLFMDGKAVWDFATVRFPEAVRNVVAKAGYSLDDVDLIVPHQSNINIIRKSMEVLGLPMEKAYSHLQIYGNMAGASVPVALDMAFKEGRVKRGDLIVICGYCGGLAWGANAIRWNKS